MHRGDWNNDFGWWWLPMALIMIAFWGAVIWAVVAVVRHGANAPNVHPSAPAAARRAPHEILGERFARGEIDAEEYRQRLDALDDRHTH